MFVGKDLTPILRSGLVLQGLIVHPSQHRSSRIAKAFKLIGRSVIGWFGSLSTLEMVRNGDKDLKL